MIKVKFALERTRILTEVKLRKVNKKNPVTYKALVDTGCTITTMSDILFHELGYAYQDEAVVKIIGINGESEGVSTVIDYFEIGGVNIGPVRVAVSRLHDAHKDRVIIGMNIILWHHFAVRYDQKLIYLNERQFAKLDMSTRYTRKTIDSSVLQNEIFTDDEF
jgi:predicted aspartyl protease